MTRQVNKQPMKQVGKILEKVHMDLCGPFQTKSFNGNKYMLTITDQYTKFKWAIFRSQKKDLVKYIKLWCGKVERERMSLGSSEKLQAIRFDRRTDSLNKEMAEWANSKMIELEPTVGYRPEANGVAERSNRTILEKGNSLRFHAGLPAEFWESSFRTGVYLGNRQPIGVKNTTR